MCSEPPAALFVVPSLIFLAICFLAVRTRGKRRVTHAETQTDIGQSVLSIVVQPDSSMSLVGSH